ncbi:MAG: thiolase family protein [Acidimicrobiales bacterium]|jgi:acetyl-CoA acetyltransferase
MASSHPYHDVAIAAVANSRQARQLEGSDSLSITLDAALSVLETAGMDASELDGVAGRHGTALAYRLGIGPVWDPRLSGGVDAVLTVAAAVAAGAASAVLLADGEAGAYTDREAMAPWTRPGNEFVAPFGMFTAAEFALIARRHMERHGTTVEQMAHVAATIRNNGSVNPEAIYYGRGPYTPADIRSSRPVADPFNLLDCATTSEGATALLITTAERAAGLRCPPVYVLGGGIDHFGPSYQHPPSWDLTGNSDVPNGYVGRRAARQAFATAGIGPDEVDGCEFYDPFSFELIRQFEAFGFCAEGEGGEFVTSGAIEPTGRHPVTTDGGTMSFSHPGGLTQMLQRVVRGVEQLQGRAQGVQLADPEVVMCTCGGAGALFNDVVLLGKTRP